MGGAPIKNLYDLVYVLRSKRAGERVGGLCARRPADAEHCHLGAVPLTLFDTLCSRQYTDPHWYPKLDVTVKLQIETHPSRNNLASPHQMRIVLFSSKGGHMRGSLHG